MGVLDEDRISCVDGQLGMSHAQRADFLGSDSRRGKCGFFLLFTAASSLFVMCISLLTNKAAQNMAARTYEGDNRVGAAVGLALSVLVPGSLLFWKRLRDKELQRLVAEFPPAAA